MAIWSRLSKAILQIVAVAVGAALLYSFASANPKRSHSLPHLQDIGMEQTVSTIREKVANGGERYSFSSNGKVLSYTDVLLALGSEDPSMAMLLASLIEKFPADAVFWECAPVTPTTASRRPFEFVLIPSSALASIDTDIGPFNEKFTEHQAQPYPPPSSKHVVAFHNLRRDAMLVVPCPTHKQDFIKPSAHFAHIAVFMRGAKDSHIVEFWRAVAGAVQAELAEAAAEGGRGADKKLWLSTSGLGVSWLHVRVDSVPKYYNFAEYKRG
jgi:hypothetical protein